MQCSEDLLDDRCRKHTYLGVTLYVYCFLRLRFISTPPIHDSWLCARYKFSYYYYENLWNVHAFDWPSSKYFRGRQQNWIFLFLKECVPTITSGKFETHSLKIYEMFIVLS